MPQAVTPSQACTASVPWTVISARKLPGRFLSMTMGASVGPIDILPVTRIAWTAFSLSRPPRASKLFAITSSTVWAAAGTARTAPPADPEGPCAAWGEPPSSKGETQPGRTDPMVRDAGREGETLAPTAA